MTLPNLPGGAPVIASAVVTVRGDADKLPNDFRKIARDIGDDADDEFEDLGHRGFSHYADGFKDEAEGSSGRQVRRSFEDLAHDLAEILQEADIRINLDDDRTRRDARRAGREAGSIFSRAFSSSGIFDIFTGPTGAFFNISGRSPLALILIPVLGAIIALVTAAVYWVQALASLLYTIPSLLFAIGLQGLVLYLIFNGIGEAAAAAFSAKNPKELEEALKGVNKEAAKFIRNLLPWRDLFRQLGDIAQTNFFKQFQGRFSEVIKNVAGPLTNAVTVISTALGRAFGIILTAFSDPKFAAVIDSITESINTWLVGSDEDGGFGLAVKNLINGLNDFALAIQPFVDWFGDEVVNGFINWLGDKFTKLSEDPEFFQWLEDSKTVIKDGVDLLGQLWDLIKTIISGFAEADKSLKEETGSSFLEVLTDLTKTLTDTIGSDEGKAAFKGFIITLEGLYAIAVAVVIILFAFFNVIGLIYELVMKVVDAISDLIDQFKSGHVTWGSFLNMFDLTDAVDAVGRGVTAILNKFGNLKDSLLNQILPNLKNAIVGFFGDTGTWLINAGIRLIEGLARGIVQAMNPGTFFSNALNKVKAGLQTLANGGNSGNGSGSGSFGRTTNPTLANPLAANGSLLLNEVAGAILMGNGVDRGLGRTVGQSITLGTGAVQVNYYGEAPPSRRQAQTMGATVGQRLLDQLVTTRTAARTM